VGQVQLIPSYHQPVSKGRMSQRVHKPTGAGERTEGHYRSPVSRSPAVRATGDPVQRCRRGPGNSRRPSADQIHAQSRSRPRRPIGFGEVRCGAVLAAVPIPAVGCLKAAWRNAETRRASRRLYNVHSHGPQSPVSHELVVPYWARPELDHA
jgi:hypothetical protein